MKLLPILLLIIIPVLCLILLKIKNKHFTETFSEASIRMLLFVGVICVLVIILFWKSETVYLQNQILKGKIVYTTSYAGDDENDERTRTEETFVPENNSNKAKLFVVDGALIAILIAFVLSAGLILQKSSRTFVQTHKGIKRRNA